MTVRRVEENAFDPKQARDARGRWTVGHAVKASHEAARASAATASEPTAKAHYHAQHAHEEAAKGAEELALRHKALGNRRAARKFQTHGETHRAHARGHAEEARAIGSEEYARRVRASRQKEARSAGARKGWERRQERADVVEANLPPHLRVFWRKNAAWFVKQHPGASADRLTEQFQEYVEENQREVARSIVDDAEARTAALIKEYERRPEREDETDDERELREEREAMQENPTMAKRRARAANVNPSLDPAAYNRTFVAELVSNAATDLQKIAEELRGGAQLSTKLRARIDADVVTLQAVSQGIAMRPASKANPSPPSYESAHWGRRSTGTPTMVIPDPRVNRKKDPNFAELGQLESISYLTRKGIDTEVVEYVHAFKTTKPRLVYGKVDGRLYIAGGSYKVTSRGIVG